MINITYVYHAELAASIAQLILVTARLVGMCPASLTFVIVGILPVWSNVPLVCTVKLVIIPAILVASNAHNVMELV